MNPCRQPPVAAIQEEVSVVKTLVLVYYRLVEDP